MTVTRSRVSELWNQPLFSCFEIDGLLMFVITIIFSTSFVFFFVASPPISAARTSLSFGASWWMSWKTCAALSKPINFELTEMILNRNYSSHKKNICYKFIYMYIYMFVVFWTETRCFFSWFSSFWFAAWILGFCLFVGTFVDHGVSFQAIFQSGKLLSCWLGAVNWTRSAKRVWQKCHHHWLFGTQNWIITVLYIISILRSKTGDEQST